MISQSGVEHGIFTGCDAPMKNRWHRIVDTLDYALQPIVNIHTGSGHGYEALLL